MKTHFKDFTKLLMLLLAMTVAFTACNDEDEVILSSESEISSFVFDGLTPAVTADVTGTTITATVPYGTDVTSLTPTIMVSEEATLDPASGTAQDFTSPVSYTVTAEDGTETTYTVTVTVEEATSLNVTPVLEFTEAESMVPDYFNMDNNEQEIAVNQNYIFVHSNNDQIVVHDITDGSVVGTMSAKEEAHQPYAATVNLFLAAIDTDDSGVILGTPRMAGPEKTFPVYKWNDKDAAQEVLFEYTKPLGYTIGNNINVVGDVSNDAQIYIPVEGTPNNVILKFTITGGTPNTTPEMITVPNVTFGGVVDVAPVSDAADADLWVAGTGLKPTLISQQGNIITSLPDGLASNDAFLNIDYFEVDGNKVLVAEDIDFNGAFADPPSSNPQKLVFIDVTDDPSVITEDFLVRVDFSSSTDVHNGNGTGGIDVVVDESAGTATVFGLITNAGVGIYTVDL